MPTSLIRLIYASYNSARAQIPTVRPLDAVDLASSASADTMYQNGSRPFRRHVCRDLSTVVLLSRPLPTQACHGKTQRPLLPSIRLQNAHPIPHLDALAANRVLPPLTHSGVRPK